MVNKRLAIGGGCMLLGGILVVTGLLRIPVVPVVLILMGGTIGFVGNRIYKKRNDKPEGKPEGMNFG